MRSFVVQNMEDGSYPFGKETMPMDAALLFGAQPVPVFEDGVAPKLDDLYHGMAGRFKLMVGKETIYTVTCVDLGRYAYFANLAHYKMIEGKMHYYPCIAFENEPGLAEDRSQYWSEITDCEAHCKAANTKGGLTPEWAQAIVSSSLRASEDRKKLRCAGENEVLLRVSVVFPNGLPDKDADGDEVDPESMIRDAIDETISSEWDEAEVNID